MMSPRPCIYNVPMALDLDLSCTTGFEPLLALAHNQGRVQGDWRCIYGPMPVSVVHGRIDMHDRTGPLALRTAFDAVPQYAGEAA
ncbi:hypothetical protein BD414DRAFT_150741 [Trametes punicea]|nr:hypothetical protein BD414DRAFT_150741 [Trametes punicea]